ncbi:MAG: hypothetical protein LAO05_08525 [Acidobacteriia bacterium]|nr:hypothetical protein [Terriglobia bacterium]
MRRRKVTWFAIAALALLAMVSGGWRRTHQPCTLQVRNSAGVAIKNVEVSLPGRRVSTGPLAPGASVSFKLWVARKGGLSVAVEVGTGVYIQPCQDCGLPAKLILEISPNFQVSYGQSLSGRAPNSRLQRAVLAGLAGSVVYPLFVIHDFRCLFGLPARSLGPSGRTGR